MGNGALIPSAGVLQVPHGFLLRSIHICVPDTRLGAHSQGSLCWETPMVISSEMGNSGKVTVDCVRPHPEPWRVVTVPLRPHAHNKCLPGTTASRAPEYSRAGAGQDPKLPHVLGNSELGPISPAQQLTHSVLPGRVYCIQKLIQSQTW